MTSQVSSPAEQADGADSTLVGEQRKPAGVKDVQRLDRVIIRFAGDSGDGMQLTGDRFTSETASFGNDLSTLPNFPAEIRAPAGTLPGVSSFQLHFADHDILTPGDAPNVLVAMNPAALKANIGDVPRGAEIIVNTDEFTKRALQKVGYSASPLDDGSLDGYSLHPVPLTTLTVEALSRTSASPARRPSAARTCSRWACCRGCTTGRPRAPRSSSRPSSRRSPTSRPPTSPRSGRVGTSARRRRTSRSPTRSPRPPPRSRPAPTATSPGTWPCPTAWSPRPGRRTSRCSWARTRSPRPRTSCTSW